MRRPRPTSKRPLRSFREVDQDYGLAHVTTYLGMAALTRGDLGRATHMFEEGLAMARSLGDRLSVPTSRCITWRRWPSPAAITRGP
jgi:hypothetical protein